MTQYQLHWWPSGAQRSSSETVRLSAESTIRGAALALRHFSQAGCDIHTPEAHLDIIEPDGSRRMLLVEEVLDWLHEPQQVAFVNDEGLEKLFT
ncbi:MAG TPA: hypothetical protein VF219_21215 [Vicinamibacterales bacterium]